jgi:short-subunit dehydrogenase
MGTALITGASAGLGLEFAWQLATAHHDVVLVARDVERLERLAGQLRAAAGVHAEVLPADLSDRADVERVAERLRASERPVGLLVNNAGHGTGDVFVGSDLAAQEAALDVMVRTVLVLSHAAAGAMVERGRGAILNVSSVAALTAFGPYSAHKAWVRVFTEGLAVELRGTGVTATALCPGLVHTEFHERAGLDRTEYPEIAWLNADQVVSAALADVRRGAVISTPSLRYGLVAEVARLLPRAAIRALSDRRSRWQTGEPDADRPDDGLERHGDGAAVADSPATT